MSDIERRIEAIEKANRRWRHAVGLLASVLLIALTIAIVLTIAAKIPDKVAEVLRAKRIEVLGPDGNPVIELKAEGDVSTLILSGVGQHNEKGVALGVVKDVAYLILAKHKEAALFWAQVDDAGASLSLYDGRPGSQEPRGVVMRSVYPTEHTLGETNITLMRGWQKEGIQAQLSIQGPAGAPSLYLGGPDGKAVSLRVNQENGRVEFLDESNKSVWSSP